jgi:hypothetical protein
MSGALRQAERVLSNARSRAQPWGSNACATLDSGKGSVKDLFEEREGAIAAGRTASRGASDAIEPNRLDNPHPSFT